MIGTTLSHFRITGKLGEGGMGEVYRATDSRLGREVAIKVLPAAMAAGAERLERFEREAHSLASLNHPNIVTIYSVEESEGLHFLVMELVEGRSLAEELAPGGLSLEKFFEIAIPLSSALAAAHAKGVTHRDLKPANIMITDEDQRVKVLDFGLAKLQGGGRRPDESLLATMGMTQEGVVLGTIPYMSPEQVESRRVDHRTDLFSLGIVFYEMLIGRRPFSGESSARLMSAILNDEPPSLTGLRSDLPPHLERVVERCLEKDPRDRLDSALDLCNDLRSLQAESSAGVGVGPGPGADSVAGRSAWRWIAGAAGGVIALALVWVVSRPGEAPPPTVGTSGTTRPVTSFVGWEHSPSWSPDGSMIAYSHIVGGSADVATLTAAGGDPHILTGESPADEFNPRWSPDGSKIAFVSDRGTGTAVYWIPATGGAEQKLVETGIPFLERMAAWNGSLGVTPWSPDSSELLFSRLQDSGDVALWKVNLRTRDEEQLTFPEGGTEDLHASYSFDGRRIVFTRSQKGHGNLYLLAADSGGALPERISEERVGGRAAWFPDNRRLVVSSRRSGVGNLWQVDLETGDWTQLTSGAGSHVSPAVSSRGAVAYTQFAHQIDIYWMPLVGDEGEERLTTYTGQNFGPRVSPDGSRIVYYSDRGGGFDLWLLDLASGQNRQLTDHPGADRLADWSPEGREIVFMSDRDGAVGIWVVEVETGTARRLTDHELPWAQHVAEAQGGPRWAPDGRFIGYLAPVEGRNAIWRVKPDGADRRPSAVRGALSFGFFKDSDRVLYTRRALDGSGLVELRAANLETGEDALIDSGAFAEVAVSPDGGGLTLVEAVSHFTMELFLLRLTEGGEPGRLPIAVGERRQLTSGAGQWHAHSGGWAPDASAVVYSRDRDYGDIFVIEPPR